jgi:transcription antitermination protein NusB
VGDAAERGSSQRVVAGRGPSPHRDIPSRKGSRSKARKRALDILFESEARAEDPLDVLRRRIAGSDAPPVSDFAQTLVEGVVAHREHIDASLGEMARGWSVERMAAVDRAILRIGAYEVLFTDDVDDAVAIDEAILLARELSTDDSPRFVNGVLAGLASGRREPVAAPERERVDVPPDAELAAPEADSAAAQPETSRNERRAPSVE